jgi:hypothetical protein
VPHPLIAFTPCELRQGDLASAEHGKNDSREGEVAPYDLSRLRLHLTPD